MQQVLDETLCITTLVSFAARYSDKDITPFFFLRTLQSMGTMCLLAHPSFKPTEWPW